MVDRKHESGGGCVYFFEVEGRCVHSSCTHTESIILCVPPAFDQKTMLHLDYFFPRQLLRAVFARAGHFHRNWVGDRRSSVYAWTLKVWERKGRMGKAKHSSEKGTGGAVLILFSLPPIHRPSKKNFFCHILSLLAKSNMIFLLVCDIFRKFPVQAKLSFSPYACCVHARGGRESFLFF